MLEELNKFSFNQIHSAVAVSVHTYDEPDHEVKDSLDELVFLAKTLNLKIENSFLQRRNRIQADYYIGKGKLEEVKAYVDEHKIDSVLFDVELTGVQARNLEKFFGKNVFGRTEIILNIFHKRAKTNEAKLQVQLACLEYMMPRLRNRWDHFSRVEGGIGMRGGEGEKQIELDRRMIKEQINRIKKKLKKVDVQMKNRRKKRLDKHLVSLVGYTNAGKSTLFNSMAKSKQFTEDMLFATLDTTVRQVYLTPQTTILLNDTVGFINKLPHSLVASFKSTLDDISSSKLLIHVIDSSSPTINRKIESVNTVLEEIGASDIPTIRVFNKIDLLNNDISNCIINIEDDDLYISALNKEGITQLKDKIAEFFAHNNIY